MIIRRFPRLYIKIYRPRAEFSAVLPAVHGLFRLIKLKWRQYILKEVLEIEQYNYMDNEDIADNILVEVENLDNRQRLALHEVIQKIKRDSEAEKTVQHMKWFDEAILPALKEFAQNTFTNLEVQRDSEGVITACLRNKKGLDISENCHCLYMALLMAVQICIDSDADEAVLALTYDCRKFVV